MKAKEFIIENKKNRRAKKYNLKPRNPMGTATQTGSGAHRDKKKEQKQGYEKHKGQGVAEGSAFDIDTTGYTKNDMSVINQEINQIKKIRAKLLKIPGFVRKVSDEKSQLRLAEKIFNLMKRGQTFDSALVLVQKQGVAEGLIGNVVQWPEIVNKVAGAMKSMGWKSQRKSDDKFIFQTKGQLQDEYWFVIIENQGEKFFSYALGTVEEGYPHLGEQDTLPMTEASISQLMEAIREGFGLSEQIAGEGSVQDKLYKRHQEQRKKSGLPDPKYYQELNATYDLPDDERLAKTAEIKKKYNVKEEYNQCPKCGGPAYESIIIAEKQDACYHKVRSRYKVWPSAYASGALVQCRKKGASNWGNKSK